jgi:beta-catenin-like protein 1
MSLDVRDILSLNEPTAKRQKTENIQSMSTANSDAKEILAALENDETLGDDEEEMDESAVKKLCIQLDKKLKKNQEMRVKHAGDPEKFMASEIDLNMAVQEMHAVATQPSLYGKMVEMGIVQIIIHLLAHENTDIVGSSVHLLQELCDIEILSENDESVAVLIDELLNNRIIEHFVTQVLSRLNNVDKDEEEAIHSVFSTMESILDFRPEAAELCIEQGLFVELMNRATLKSSFDPNKLYASQLLSVILQTSENAKAKLVEKKDGIDFLLRALASYKRKDPATADETEHMENLFDALCAALLRKENRLVFLKDEGNELMYLMLKEKKASREGALRVLSYVTAVPDGVENCDHFVEMFGLRVIFPLFMKTPSKAKRKDTTPIEHEEHVCSIIEALLYSCSSDNRKRVLSKFDENDCEKVERLVELFLSHSDRLRRYMNRMKKQGIQMDDDELHAERLNNGFYTLSKIALILADVCLSSYFTCKEKASNLFRMKTKNPSIKAHLEPVLLEMLENLGEEAVNQRERIELIISQLKIQEEGPSMENDEENGKNGSSSEHVSESNDAVVETDTSQ